MLPLRHNDLVSKRSGLLGRFKDKITGWIRLIWSDPNSRNLLGFLILNFSFAFVELIYGVSTNSLGLISDSFHMFFDCTGLMAGLVSDFCLLWVSKIVSVGSVLK
jgi:zinc transporter 5/7